MASFHCGNLVSWSSKKQQAVTKLGGGKVHNLQSGSIVTPQPERLFLKVKCCLFLDNQGDIHMMRNYENTRCSKHINIKFHFLKDVIAKKLMSNEYVESDKNIADVFTKPL
ncbi:hypothetical protein PR048_011227, partial [Dryococelus australis]